MRYVDEFHGMPHRTHDPMGPPSAIWLVGATAVVAMVMILVMIVGMAT